MRRLHVLQRATIVPDMELPPETMLAANALIHQHGDGAEEFAAQQVWDSRQKKEQGNVAHWLSMLEALKRVRELRAKIKRGS